MSTIAMAPPKRPEIKTELPGPKGKEIIAADALFVTPSYPRPSFKLVAERAQGVWVEDVDGNVFLDCNAGVAVFDGPLPSGSRTRDSGAGGTTDPHVRDRLLLPSHARAGQKT
jgi:hypothetical protein